MNSEVTILPYISINQFNTLRCFQNNLGLS